MQPAKSNLVRHLHCENDPAVTKHNRIPSVINPPTTLVIPFINYNGIPSVLYPPEPLIIPFRLRERSYNSKL